MGVGLVHGHAADLYRPETFDVDCPFGRHRAGDGFLRSTPDIYEYGVAGAEAVIRRRRNVHVRFESQQFLVEYVAAEDLYSFLFFSFRHDFVEPFQRVHEHEVQPFHVVVFFPLLEQAAPALTHDGLVLLFLNDAAAVIFGILELVIPFVAVVFPEALFRGAFPRDVLGAQYVAFLFLFVFFSYPSDLLDIDAALHQSGYDLLLRRSLGVFSDNKLHDLLVGHGGLGMQSWPHGKQ